MFAITNEINTIIMKIKEPVMKADWQTTLLGFAVGEGYKYSITRYTSVSCARMACNRLKKDKGLVFETATTEEFLTIKRIS